MSPLWGAYYADREQQVLEQAAMEVAPPGEKLTARLAVFHQWWERHVGVVIALADGTSSLAIPSEEIPCGECADGWVERWLPVNEIERIAS
jgi:hypothetical protein